MTCIKCSNLMLLFQNAPTLELPTQPSYNVKPRIAIKNVFRKFLFSFFVAICKSYREIACPLSFPAE